MSKSNRLRVCRVCKESFYAVDGNSCDRCRAVSLLGFESELSVPEETILRKLGDYALIEEVGRGSMGVVYRARQASLGREVAVKILRDSHFAEVEAVRRFHEEASIASRLSHPNIVSVFEVGQFEDEHYLAMELVRGPSLADAVRGGSLSPLRAARLTSRIALAVQYAHEQGVLHRDLKPGNVLLDLEDNPYVTDFGLARQFDRDRSLTRTGQLVGTPAYMAPEQASGTRRLGPQADVYSLGALLYHLLTGRAPFIGASISEVLRKVALQEPIAVDSLNPVVPRDLASVCLKCLEKVPERRYTSAGDLSSDLERFIEGHPTMARPVGALGRTRSWCRREPRIAGLALAIVVLSLAIATLATLSSLRMARSREAQAVAERQARRRLVETQIILTSLERKGGKFGARSRALDAVREAVRNGANAAEKRVLRDEAANALLMTDLELEKAESFQRRPQGTFVLGSGANCVVTSNGIVRLATKFGHVLEISAKPSILPELSPDQKWMVLTESRGISLWNIPEQHLWGLFDAYAIEFWPGDRWAIVRGNEPTGWTLLDLTNRQTHNTRGAFYLTGLSPDGNWATLAQEDGLSIWRLPEMSLERKIPEIWTRRSAGQIAFSPDSQRLAVLVAGDTPWTQLRLVSMKDFSFSQPTFEAEVLNRDPRASSANGAYGFHQVRWLKNRKLLLNYRNGLAEVDPDSGKTRWPCGTRRDGRRILLGDNPLDSEERFLVLLSELGRIEIWDWPTDTLLRSAEASHKGTGFWQGGSFNLWSHDPQGNWSTRSSFKVIGSGIAVPRKIEAHHLQIRNIPGIGECWIWLEKDGAVRIQPLDGTLTDTMDVGKLGPGSFLMSKNGSIGVWTDGEKLRAVSFSLENGLRPAISLPVQLENGESIEELALSHDGTVLALRVESLAGSRLITMDLRSRQIQASATLDKKDSDGLEISADGSWLQTGKYMWNTAECRMVQQIATGLPEVNGFSTDGKWVTQISNSFAELIETKHWRTLGRWATSNAELAHPTSHFSPDGRWLALRIRANELSLVGLDSLQVELSLELPVHVSGDFMTFSPTGKYIFLNGRGDTGLAIDLESLLGQLEELELGWNAK